MSIEYLKQKIDAVSTIETCCDTHTKSLERCRQKVNKTKQNQPIPFTQMQICLLV